jgi:hypothetical protein
VKWLVLILIAVMLAGCGLIRTDVVKPALTEEIAWTKMLNGWSVKAYASRDFRAGFLQASTKPWMNQMPVVLNSTIQDMVNYGNADSEGFKAGAFGGTTLAFYGVLSGQGTRWLLEQLFNLGMIPTSLSALLLGG